MNRRGNVYTISVPVLCTLRCWLSYLYPPVSYSSSALRVTISLQHISLNPQTIINHPSLQQSQPPRNPINHTPRPRPHPKHRRTPTRHLRPPRIPYNPRAQPHPHRLRPQLLQLLFGWHLHGDFRLPGRLPPTQQRGRGRVGKQVFVAGEGRVGALGGGFACGGGRVLAGVVLDGLGLGK